MIASSERCICLRCKTVMPQNSDDVYTVHSSVGRFAVHMRDGGTVVRYAPKPRKGKSNAKNSAKT